MCGILTYYNTVSGTVPKSLKCGLDSMKHRGPDSEGTFCDKGVFLGHHRLKIIDLSDNANQPMSCGEGRYWIVFNGEIYNYQELRPFLEAKGHRFKTQSDTEVLLKMYIELGEGCLKHLNGMFAFAIYDNYTRKLFAARDRLGIKPLYYFWNGKVFVMASEIRALVESKIVPRELDSIAIQQYLMLGSVQSPHTIIKSIKTLMPGHFLFLENHELKINEYWYTPFISEGDKRFETFEDAKKRVRELLEDSIRLRLISDVPLGVFLSGGIDSSTIVALMSKLGASKISTFSIGFDVGGSTWNETNFAKWIANRYNTNHNEIIINGDDIAQEIPNFFHFLDQPSIDGLNTYLVSKFSREHTTVCLSGLGGDEVFGGYTWVKFQQAVTDFRKRFPFIPQWAGPNLRSIYEQLPAYIQKSKILRIGLGLLGAWTRPFDMYNQFHNILNQSELKQLLINYETEENNYYEKRFDVTELLSSVDAGCLLDQSLYLRNQLLRDVDAVSMAHSLEVRVPFLDHRLVEYVAQLPSSVKFKHGHAKYLLVEAVRELLPKEVFQRKKMGFSFPIGIWLHSGKFREILLDCFSSNGLKRRKIFDSRFLDRLLKKGLKENPFKKRSPLHYKLFSLLVLELWMREFLDN